MAMNLARKELIMLPSRTRMRNLKAMSLAGQKLTMFPSQKEILEI